MADDIERAPLSEPFSSLSPSTAPSSNTRHASSLPSDDKPPLSPTPSSAPPPSHSTDTPLHPSIPAPIRTLLSRPPLARIISFLRGAVPPERLPGPEGVYWPARYLGWIDRVENTVCRWTRPCRHPALMLVFWTGWIIGVAFLAKASWWDASTSLGDPTLTTCIASFWQRNDGCGLNGTSCGPFSSSDPYVFRCPASCAATSLSNQRPVGPLEVNSVPLLVGGGEDGKGVYRADSWICPSFVHAGGMSDRWGGCGSLRLVGEHTNYTSSTLNGFTSYPFPSAFPSSYVFDMDTSSFRCADLRWPTLGFNIAMSVIAAVVFRPGPLVFFWTLICLGFWHVTLASEPRDIPPPLEEAFKTFLPCLFVSYALYRIAFRFCLPFFTRVPLERALWYLAPMWIGLMLPEFGNSPLDRLYGDIPPRAIVALVIIILVIVVVVINQIRVMRKTGTVFLYLRWYFAFGLFVIMPLCLLPGLHFRLHHYILALLLLPLTAFPTRISAICQAFLLGLFLEGVARWDFDSILQTWGSLLRDAALGTDLPSFVGDGSLGNGTVLQWAGLPEGGSWDGFALIINDVLRYTGNATSFDLAGWSDAVPWFARLAYQQAGTSGDFTRAATVWLGNGTFMPPLPGPS